MCVCSLLVTVSKKTLQRVETIKQSSVAHLDKAMADPSLSSSDEEEEDKTKEKELLAKTLRKYYMSLATSSQYDRNEKQS